MTPDPLGKSWYVSCLYIRALSKYTEVIYDSHRR